MADFSIAKLTSRDQATGGVTLELQQTGPDGLISFVQVRFQTNTTEPSRVELLLGASKALREAMHFVMDEAAGIT